MPQERNCQKQAVIHQKILRKRGVEKGISRTRDQEMSRARDTKGQICKEKEVIRGGDVVGNRYQSKSYKKAEDVTSVKRTCLQHTGFPTHILYIGTLSFCHVSLYPLTLVPPAYGVLQAHS